MALTRRQIKILLGTLMGDGRLQVLSKRSARLRIEHSLKQRFYVWWKHREFQKIMQDKPEVMERENPIFGKVYHYCRCQTLTLPELRKFYTLFYKRRRKIISPELKKLFISPLSLAVWYMDDGYYYRRDKTAYIYLSNYSRKEFQLLQEILQKNFGLENHLYRKKKGYCFYFPVKDTKKLIKLVRPYVLEKFRYKISS